MAIPQSKRTLAAFIACATLHGGLLAQAQTVDEQNVLRPTAPKVPVVLVSLRTPLQAAQASPNAQGLPNTQSSRNTQGQPNAQGQPSSQNLPANQPGLGSPLPSANRPDQVPLEQMGGQLQGSNPPPGDGGRLAPITMLGVNAPISAANISVEEIGTKIIPEDQSAKQNLAILPLPGGQERAMGYLTYRWQSANICHWPLYFEEPMLERHGQQICPPCLQPAVSGTKFLSNLLLFPYKATLQPPLESRYTLGHFRPGSQAPLLRDTLPWSPRAAAVQGVAVTGVAVGLPW